MPPSLPWPDSFTPPNGVSGVETATELTPTIPDAIASPIAAAAGGGGRVRTRERIGRQPIRQRVRAFHHLVEGLEGDDRRDRPERLLRHHFGVVGDVGHDRGLVEKALVAVALAAGNDVA